MEKPLYTEPIGTWPGSRIEKDFVSRNEKSCFFEDPPSVTVERNKLRIIFHTIYLLKYCAVRPCYEAPST